MSTLQINIVAYKPVENPTKWLCKNNSHTRNWPSAKQDALIAKLWRKRGLLGPPACCGAGADRLIAALNTRGPL